MRVVGEGAVVLGASIGGILAARVRAEHDQPARRTAGNASARGITRHPRRRLDRSERGVHAVDHFVFEVPLATE